MSLRPAETIERILISSTSRFIAEYESDGVVITHAWPTSFLRMEEGPLSRSAFMLSFIVREVPRLPGVKIPDHEAAGEMICSLLSLLYGKRFDTHGRVQSHGSFFLPHLAQFNSLCIPKLPQNDHSPRSDIAVPLDLRHIARLSPMLTGQVADPAKATALKSAAKFYRQALQNGETDPEVAYLHLITAGEILANTHCHGSADYLDDTVRAILDQVRLHVPDGEKSAKILANQMRQIKRRFCLTLEDLIDEQFFSATKNAPDWQKLRKLKRKDFSKRVTAAYDIRSHYVHTGNSFGDWIAPRESLEEVLIGLPRLEDAKIAKLLQSAPTYIGLERVIRYCLIRFAERHKLIVDAAS